MSTNHIFTGDSAENDDFLTMLRERRPANQALAASPIGSVVSRIWSLVDHCGNVYREESLPDMHGHCRSLTLLKDHEPHPDFLKIADLYGEVDAKESARGATALAYTPKEVREALLRLRATVSRHRLLSDAESVHTVYRAYIEIKTILDSTKIHLERSLRVQEEQDTAYQSWWKLRCILKNLEDIFRELDQRTAPVTERKNLREMSANNNPQLKALYAVMVHTQDSADCILALYAAAFDIDEYRTVRGRKKREELSAAFSLLHLMIRGFFDGAPEYQDMARLKSEVGLLYWRTVEPALGHLLTGAFEEAANSTISAAFLNPRHLAIAREMKERTEAFLLFQAQERS